MDIGRERGLWYHRDTTKRLPAPQPPSPLQRAEQEGMRHGQPTQLQRYGRLSAFPESDTHTGNQGIRIYTQRSSRQSTPKVACIRR